MIKKLILHSNCVLETIGIEGTYARTGRREHKLTIINFQRVNMATSYCTRVFPAQKVGNNKNIFLLLSAAILERVTSISAFLIKLSLIPLFCLASATSAESFSILHIVKPKDTLSQLSASYLKDASKWRDIAAANPHLANANILPIGTQLVIPLLVGIMSESEVPATLRASQTQLVSAKHSTTTSQPNNPPISLTAPANFAVPTQAIANISGHYYIQHQALPSTQLGNTSVSNKLVTPTNK